MPDPDERDSHLRAACSASGDDMAIAVLWLLDRSTLEFHLDRHTHIAESECPPCMRKLSVRTSEADIKSNDLSNLQLDKHADIASWVAEQLGDVHDHIFPVENAGALLGALQVITQTSISSFQATLIDFLSMALGRSISSQREQRRLEAARDLRNHVDSVLLPPSDWFLATASVVQDHTSGSICIVFRQQNDLSFSCVASSPKLAEGLLPAAGSESVIRRIADIERTVRFVDFYNDERRTELIGSSKYDEKLADAVTSACKAEIRSWMAAPVVVGGSTLAVVVVINKKKHYAAAFSETDESIMKDVCQILSHALPGVETVRSISRIANTVFPLSLEDEDSRSRKEVYGLLKDLFPGLVGASVVAPPGLSSSIYGPTRMIHHLGGLQQLYTLEDFDAVPAGKVTKVQGSKRDSAESLFITTLGEKDAPLGHLVLSFARPQLADYELLLLKYISAEITQVVKSVNGVRKQLTDLAQLRHAIRSGLNGMNHLEVVMGNYQLYKDGTRGAEVFATSEFGKSLRRTGYFLKKTQTLLESARFLLNNISKDTLRFGDNSLRRMIANVSMCVKPFADRRRISISDPSLLTGGGDRIVCDLQLVDILLFNIVENAAKYSFKNQEVAITITRIRSRYLIAIKNTGVLIPRDSLQSIFHEFVRKPTGEASTTRPGTGLGLPVALAVAEAHGGTIAASSIQRRSHTRVIADTTFTITLPIDASKA